MNTELSALGRKIREKNHHSRLGYNAVKVERDI